MESKLFVDRSINNEGIGDDNPDSTAVFVTLFDDVFRYSKRFSSCVNCFGVSKEDFVIILLS